MGFNKQNDGEIKTWSFFTQYLQIHDGIVKIRGNNFNVINSFKCKPQIYTYKTMIKPLNMMKNNKVRNKIIAISRLYSETFYFMRYTLKFFKYFKHLILVFVKPKNVLRPFPIEKEKI